VSVEPPERARVAIVLDVDDASPDLLFVCIAAGAVRLVEDLRQKGLDTDLVRIELDGHPELSW
jgi:hypothetical protein